PYTGWATLAFLALVVVLMAFSDGAERIAFYSLPAIVIVLAVGWRFVVARRKSALVPG
ncbi:L-asparagine permease, partial [Kibdelosporangium lantanae]